MATKDVMLDIETLSTSVDALVLSIGAKGFSCEADGLPISDTGILVVPSFFEQVLQGRRIDRDTQLWWGAKERAEATKHWIEPEKVLTVRAALVELGDYMRDADRVWCRGTHFDVAILDSLSQAFGLKSPWRYNAPRDVRSFTEQREIVRSRPATADPAPVALLPLHHPFRDCDEQIMDLWDHGLK